MKKYVTLGEVCKLNMGQSPDSSTYNDSGEGIPFYQGNADFGKINPITSHWCTSPTKIAEDGDILISVRAPIGALNIATEQCCIGRGLAAITVNNEVVSRDYIWYMLKSRVTMLQSMGTGSTFKAINKNVLNEMLFLLPTLEEQNKIAVNLSKIDKIIRICTNLLNRLDVLVKSRFVEMFGDPVSNSMNWQTVPLGELSTKIGSGATPKGGRESYGTEGISLIRSMNVHNGYFEFKDLAHISNEQAEKLDNVTIHDNDVLLNITGASVARCCIVPSDVLPARVNQHVCIIRCKSDILPIFVCGVLTDDNYQKHLWGIAGSGATREAITKQQIENLSMIVPTLNLQNQFAAFVAQTDKSKYSALNIKENIRRVKFYDQF